MRQILIAVGIALAVSILLTPALIGLFTRPVAFLVSGEMAIAYFHGHAPNGFWPVLNGGHPAVLFCFVWLFFSAAGAGPWSVDGLIRRETARADAV